MALWKREMGLPRHEIFTPFGLVLLFLSVAVFGMQVNSVTRFGKFQVNLDDFLSKIVTEMLIWLFGNFGYFVNWQKACSK